VKILFTCGGTGGHINPAIALAKMVLSRHPEADIAFVGSNDGLETKLIAKEGFKLYKVHISSFMRKISLKSIKHNFGTVFKIKKSINEAKDILSEFKPDVVVGTGGYASFPLIYAAAETGVPTAVHEANVRPGLTTKMLASKVDVMMVNYSDCIQFYKNSKRVVITGMPIKEDFIFTKPKEAKEKLNMLDKPLVVSYWGSLGAREMNKDIAEFIKLESAEDKFYHIHATGTYGWRWMPEYVKKLGVDLTKHKNIDMREYIFNMPEVMAAADVVICRAGASTLSEITALAKPSIIVPSPNVAANHQEKNARLLENNNAAIVIKEKDCSGEVLYRKVCELFADTAKLKEMSRNLNKMAILDANEKIYKIIMELSKNNK